MSSYFIDIFEIYCFLSYSFILVNVNSSVVACTSDYVVILKTNQTSPSPKLPQLRKTGDLSIERQNVIRESVFECTNYNKNYL